MENIRRRIVVKVGSSSVTEENRVLSLTKIRAIVEQIHELRETGLQVLLVSSGAIAAGTNRLGLNHKPRTTSLKQAAAAVGQTLLMQTYAGMGQELGITVGQVLLTRHDFAHRQSYNNALNSLEALLEHGILPILNENDTVVVSQHSFGDNDRLASLVAGLVQADYLMILTDIDGLYTGDPRTTPTATRIPFVSEFTPELLGMAGSGGSAVGTGGMASKLAAAKRAMLMGIPSFVGRGDTSLLTVLERKGNGTYFGNEGISSTQRKLQWIAFHAAPTGKVTVDLGASHALRAAGKSLLPAGVLSVEGNFQRGDVIELYDSSHAFIGRGLVNYTANELSQVRGQSTRFAKQVLHLEQDEVVHRDNLALIE
jgi:glutamate 5-kinase